MNSCDYSPAGPSCPPGFSSSVYCWQSPSPWPGTALAGSYTGSCTARSTWSTHAFSSAESSSCWSTHCGCVCVWGGGGGGGGGGGEEVEGEKDKGGWVSEGEKDRGGGLVEGEKGVSGGYRGGGLVDCHRTDLAHAYTF